MSQVRKDFLKRMFLLICLSASVMSGKNAGVQTLMRQNYMPKGLYIHCFTHRLNLVIGDVCKVILYIDEFMAILSKIHEYFTCSSVTNEYFRHAQRSLQLGKIFKNFLPILFLSIPSDD